MSEPPPPPGVPVVVTEVAPAATAALVEAAAAGSAGATGPAAVGLSAAATEKLVDAVVLATPPKRPASPAQEAEAQVATAGQRRVNLIWEFTQSLIALMVASSTMYVSLTLALRVQSKEAATAIILLSNAFFLVSGFYFGRTNHQKTGGVGEKDGGR